MEIIVGRQGQQPFTISESTVSRKHVKITYLPDGTFQIEDLNSASGTFVDGKQVIKKIVTADTIVELGKKYKFRVGDVVQVLQLPQLQNNSQSSQKQQPVTPTYSIAPLEQIWQQYHDDIAELDNRQKNIMLWARVSPLFTIASGAIAGVVGRNDPAIQNLCIAFTVVGAVVMAISIYKQLKFDYKKEKEIIDNGFIKKYICPNAECHRFLNFQNYTILSQNKQCPYCRSKWTTK